jgi:zinc D-Ala-D-Ala dipeptidase
MNKLIRWTHIQYVRCCTLRAFQTRDWQTVPINDNNEPLVLVPHEHCYPYYASVLGAKFDHRMFVREKVIELFLRAKAYVQEEGFDLRMYDGWRSVEVQRGLFWYYMREFTVGKFGLAEKFLDAKTASETEERFSDLSASMQSTLIGANRVYVSLPSEDPSTPSPHCTGGAIDVWLYQGGKAANLGVPYDWMEENAGAFYHFKRNRGRFTGNERKIIANRNTLLYAMIRAGFTCYGPEIWHYNYGNQMHGLVTGKPAIYSFIDQPDSY